MASQPQDRPYRSHHQPACIPCRKRKSRCKLGPGTSARCLMCEVHGSNCVFPRPGLPASATGNTRKFPQTAPQAARASRPAYPTKPADSNAGQSSGSSIGPRSGAGTRARIGAGLGNKVPAQVASKHSTRCRSPMRTTSDYQEVPFANVGASPRSLPGPQDPGSNKAGPQEDDEAHVIGPVHSPDAELIQSYLMRDPAAGRGPGLGPVGGAAAMTGSATLGQRPVMFSAVRRHPLGRSAGLSAAGTRLEVVEKLLEPYADDLVDLYFDKVHLCYPLLDERAFRLQYVGSKAKLSPALLTSLYAQSLVYWKQTLPEGRHCPDIRYIWNQANEALYWELYQSPGLSTIVAILLNISGRPLSSMIGNAVLLGSAISLAHCLGLNRNCLSWDITEAEKAHRIRLWWAIVVYDNWSSVAYGTPPRLQACQHDVPAPTVDLLLPRCSENDGRGNSAPEDTGLETEAMTIFVALVALTGILQDYLGHVFDLSAREDKQSPSSTAATVSMQLENRLSAWADSLPHQLRRVIVRGVNIDAPGAANLRLSYLYLRLLVRKLGLDIEKRQVDSTVLLQQQLGARQAAEDIVIFVQELDAAALSDFWLSFNAFALSSTAAFLLRSALQSHLSSASGQQRDREFGGLHTGEQDCTSESNAESRPSIRDDIHIRLAADLVAALESHRKEYSWDLANICIAQYADIVEHLQTALHPATGACTSAPQSSGLDSRHGADVTTHQTGGEIHSSPDSGYTANILARDAMPFAMFQQYQQNPYQLQQPQQQPLPQDFSPFDIAGGMHGTDFLPGLWDNIFDTV